MSDQWQYDINPAYPRNVFVVDQKGFTFFYAIAPAHNDIKGLIDRACACVNACGEMTTEQLKTEYADGRLYTALGEMNQQLFALRNELDAERQKSKSLAAALKEFADKTRFGGMFGPTHILRDERFDTLSKALSAQPTSADLLKQRDRERDAAVFLQAAKECDENSLVIEALERISAARAAGLWVPDLGGQA